MSYQVLARKWRPTNFTQVAGQSHVLKSLVNALDNERLHHAYLFTGTRGVGKTTLARILAKCLNCETGITSEPCEQCAACTEINEGRFIDLIEVDAASRTKVEDTRELLDNVQYTPSRGRFKVYLIDEVHMLSNHSFNALLKTLEEPPPHVKFLFATTDPQKLPVTILSRCLQFNLKNLSPKMIVDYLQTVLNEEEIEYDEQALWQIAAGAAGSMRDALTLVDQAISYCQGSVSQTGVVEMLGVPESEQIFQLLKAMAEGNVHTLLELVNKLSDRVPDYAHTLESLLSSLHRLALAQIAPDTLDNSFGDKEQLLSLAQKFSAEDIQLFYQIGVKGKADLRSGVDVRSAFEMLLLRMMVFSPELTDEDLKPTLTTEKESGSGEPVKKKTETDEPVSASEEPAYNDEIKVQAEGVLESAISSEEVDAGNDRPEEFVENGTGRIEFRDLSQASWLKIFPQLEISGIAANVLANVVYESSDANEIRFVLDQSQSAVYSEELLPKIAQALGQYFEAPVDVKIKVGSANSETPAQLAARLKHEFHEDLIQQFEKDDNVKQLIERFAANVEKESITPIESSK